MTGARGDVTLLAVTLLAVTLLAVTLLRRKDKERTTRCFIRNLQCTEYNDRDRHVVVLALVFALTVVV